MSLKELRISRFAFILLFFIHFIITFFTDRFYFEKMTLESEHIVSYILVKLLLLVLLTVFWQAVYELTVNRNSSMRETFKYAMIYFVPMMVLLFIMWPGPIADGDIPYFMLHESKYSYNYYLHYITSLVHILGLMVFPFLTGIIIFQSFCYSLIVGYTVKRAVRFFGSKTAYLIYAIFMIPSMAYYSLYINRTPVYGYIYVLLLSVLIFDFLEGRKLDLKKLASLMVMAAVLSTLRYEGIYLVVTVPILMVIAYRPKRRIRSFVAWIICIVVTMNIVGIPQSIWEKEHSDSFANKRLIPAIVHSMSNMLEYDIEGDFETIDKVVSVDIMREHANIHNITPLSMGAERKGYTEEEGELFVRESVRIFLKNLPEFLKVRFETFHFTALESEDMIQDFDYYMENSFSGKSLFVEEKFPEARKKTIKLLVNNPSSGEFSFGSPLLAVLAGVKNAIAYNIYIPILILLLVLVIGMAKKSWFWVTISMGLFVHIGLIFMLAPATFFMYYVPINMTGWFIGVLFAVSFLAKNKEGRKVSLFERE